MANFSNLPAEITLNILSRLPTESVMQCKVVCKPWLHISRHPSFPAKHLAHLTDHHDNSKLTFLISSSSFSNIPRHLSQFPSFLYPVYEEKNVEDPSQSLSYFEYEENVETVQMNKLKIRLPLDVSSYAIVGSCNGVICLNALPANNLSIYNPITKEYVILPNIDRVRNPEYAILLGIRNPKRNYTVYGGFGYLLRTNEYKVVRIVDQSEPKFNLGLAEKPNFECVEVYTLGSGNGWRNLGDCGLNSSAGSTFINSNAVFLNETLYWITWEGNVVAFNLVDEKFVEYPALPRPLPAGTSGLVHIGVLGGFLQCSILNRNTNTADIWLLKKNGNINEQEEHRSFSWNNEDFRPFQMMHPFSLLKSGGLLCKDLYGALFSYNINSTCVKTLVTKGIPQTNRHTVPHMKTFISLKALGEEGVETMNKTR